MTKTREELTAEWKAGNHKENIAFYCRIEDEIKILTSAKDDYGQIRLSDDSFFYDDDEIEIITPVPTYDEYKAMQDQIANASKKVEELEDRIAELEKIINNLKRIPAMAGIPQG